MGAKRDAKKAFEREQELAKLRAADEKKQAAKRAAEQRREKAETARAIQRSAMTPAQRTAQDGSERAGMWVIGIVLLALLGGCVYFGNRPSDDNDNGSGGAQVEQEDDVDVEEMKFTAFDMCKGFVKDRLKAPGSATFRNFFQDDGEVEVSGAGRGPYKVVSSVDAENSFGAKERIPFTCTVTNTEGDTWRLVEVNLVE